MGSAGVPGSENILIAGAGMVGLGAALSLANGKRQITLIERDPPPPQLPPLELFQAWERRGVAQFRHSHIFLGRLTMLLRQHFPVLMDELLVSGARILTFEEALSPHLKHHYRPEPGDEDLSLLFCRRTTLEFVLRRYVERLPGVRVMPQVVVRGLTASRQGDQLAVKGLVCERAGLRQKFDADVVIDASGRGSLFPNWLREEGIAMGEEASLAGILYFTRHYRIHAEAQEPPFGESPMAGDLGYIKYGICPADGGHFSITLAVPEIEKELHHAISYPVLFDTVCAQLPSCARWTDPARAAPVSPVYAMGNLAAVWRTLLKNGKPQVLNFFIVGDAAIRTNPLYGRGCSVGIVQAHALRAILDTASDPAERALMFEACTRKSFRSHYEAMVRQDMQSIRRAERVRAGGNAGLKARLRKNLIEEGAIPAMRGDLKVVRAVARAFHMIDPPVSWRNRPAIFARVIWRWAKPTSFKRAARLYPASRGPERTEMLARVGLA